MPPRFHRLRDPILDAEILVKARYGGYRRRRGRGSIQPRGDPVVGELRAIHHHRPVDAGFPHCAVGANLHLDHDSQPFFAVGKRREVGREPLRKHRKDFGGGINRGGVGPRVAIDSRAFFYDRVDVRHRDENLYRAARELLRDRKLIEVERIIVVDRGPQQAPKISQRRIRRGGRVRDGAGLRHDLVARCS